MSCQLLKYFKKSSTMHEIRVLMLHRNNLQGAEKMETTQNSEMNVIDKKKMLEGCLFNFSLDQDITSSEMDALIAARELLRKAGLICSSDMYSRIIVRRTKDRKEIAIALAI